MKVRRESEETGVKLKTERISSNRILHNAKDQMFCLVFTTSIKSNQSVAQCTSTWIQHQLCLASTFIKVRLHESSSSLNGTSRMFNKASFLCDECYIQYPALSKRRRRAKQIFFALCIAQDLQAIGRFERKDLSLMETVIVFVVSSRIYRCSCSAVFTEASLEHKERYTDQVMTTMNSTIHRITTGHETHHCWDCSLLAIIIEFEYNALFGV